MSCRLYMRRRSGSVIQIDVMDVCHHRNYVGEDKQGATQADEHGQGGMFRDVRLVGISAAA